jgi:hypothetical protein
LQAVIGKEFTEPIKINASLQATLGELYDDGRTQYEVKHLVGDPFLQALQKLASGVSEVTDMKAN